METLTAIVNGFYIALTPTNIFYLFIGTFLGTVIGVLPGIGPAAGIALLIPITYGMNPTTALIMMAGIYYGAQYGGSTTSILINVPGESSSVMTCLDGYQMAKKGRGGAALAISAVGSFIAGTAGVVMLTFLAVPLADVAIRFGPAEYFTLMLFALTSVNSLGSKSFAKGMISTILGLMLATVGIDLQVGIHRYTMGVPELQDGIKFVIVAVGLFALGEVFINVEELYKNVSEPIRIKGKVWFTKEEWRRSISPIMRGGVIGFLVGVLPGAGATIASMLSYVAEKRISKHPEEFGKGAIEGLAGPESANNSCVAGAMVPLLTLGVPGSGATAVLLGAFIMFGIQPGPLLFKNNPNLVWGLIDSMYMGNLMLVMMNLPLVGLFVRLLYIPIGILLPLILGISLVGAYSLATSILDLYMVFFFGIIGYFFRKADFPLAPLVLALVLGDMMEQSFRRAMTISGGNPAIFINSFISVFFLVMAIFSVTLPYVLPWLKIWWQKSSTRIKIFS